MYLTKHDQKIINDIKKFKFKWYKTKDKLIQIKDMSEKILSFYNLKFKFKFDNAKTRAGMCSYKHRYISLSKHFCLLNSYEEIESTIIHEVAHILAAKLFNDYGHNVYWKAIDIRLGDDGSRCCNNSVTMPKGKYEYICLCCGYIINRHRKITKLVACYNCCKTYNNGNFTKDYLLYLK